MSFISIETLALVIIIAVAAVVEIRAARRSDMTLKENTAEMRKLADNAKPLRNIRRED